jgi:hypothetical protein
MASKKKQENGIACAVDMDDAFRKFPDSRRARMNALTWIAMVAFMFIVTWESVQLTRPDDDWKGWSDPSVPYQSPRWGVQPRPLLKLIAVVGAMFLLADWMKNDTGSILSAWLE